MPEFLEIVFKSFLRLGVTFAMGYGLYRLVLFIASRLRGRFYLDGSKEAWDSVEILYRIPFGVFGFLILHYAVICIGSAIGSGGRGIHGMASPLIIFTYGMNSLIGITGCAVIFGATVFGIYQDYPPAPSYWVSAASLLFSSALLHSDSQSRSDRAFSMHSTGRTRYIRTKIGDFRARMLAKSSPSR